MSRGRGRWQQAILERLNTREQFYLYELLPLRPEKMWSRSFARYIERPRSTRADRVAVLRAAHRLATQGLIQLDTRRWWTNHSRWTGDRWQRLGAAIVARPGVVMEPFEVRVRRWVEMSHECFVRLRTDPRCPVEVQAEAQRLQVMCEHLGDSDPRAWWPEQSEDLP